jgi:predicted RNA methylase
MPLLRRLKQILHGHGLRGVAAKLVGKAFDRAFEVRYGIDTLAHAKLDGLTIVAGQPDAGIFYEGSRVMPLRGLLKALHGTGNSEAEQGALVDLGCGKGKVLLVAAECGVAKVRGVEFARELCDVARANWEKFRAKTGSIAEVEIIEGDAGAYPIRPDETVFFLFNPFGAAVLTRVLTNIAASVRQHPRRVRIVVTYLSAHYRRVFEEQKEFTFEREIVTWAYNFTVFSNAVSERR